MADDDLRRPWYVVADEWCSYPDDEDVMVWTLSQDPNKTGWETDCGFDGYGLTKAQATFLAEAANEKIAREGGSEPLPLAKPREERCATTI